MTVLLNKYYNKNSEIEFVDHDDTERFLDEELHSQYDSFSDLYEATNSFDIKTTVLKKKKLL